MDKKRPRGPRINVVLTDEIVRQAAKRDSQHCMIAEAIRTAFPTAKAISVDLATIRFTDPSRRLRFTYLTPRVAQVELVKFDQGIKTAPFSFLLRGAHVTRSGSADVRRAATKPPKQVRSESQKLATAKARKAMARQTIASRGAVSTVPDRVGGKTPPVQRDALTKLPFSRRRAFGLRGLAL